jgi:outer membrane protein assembly factor BamB
MLKHNTLKSLLFIALVGLTLSGCAGLEGLKEASQSLGDSLFGAESNAEPPAELQEYKPELTIDVLWKENIGVGKEKQNLKLNLAISAGKVFVADKEGLVQARASDNGHLLWETKTELPLSAGPGLSADSVILGSSDAKVVALNNQTGETLWTTTVSSEVLAEPVIADNVVIVRTTDGAVIALDEKDGHKLWKFEESVPALILRGLGKAIIIKDHVMVGFSNGKLVAMELKTGKSVWETTVAMPTGRSEVERLVDLVADPVENEGIIYISSYHGGSSAVATTDGGMVWRNEHLSSAAGLTFDNRYLYLTDSNSDVWQVDQRNGATLWKQQELHYRLLTAPAIYEEYVVVGDFSGYLHWLSRSDGRQLGRVQVTKQAIDSKPVVVDDVIYVYAKDGTLAALKAKVL